MRFEGGQATLEWMALVLLGALVLGAAAALSGRETDRGLGEAVAERIAPAAALSAPERESAAAPPPGEFAAGPPPREFAAAPQSPPARESAAGPPPPPASTPRAVDAFRRLRGIGEVARHTWIVCLGYRRWRYELEHPMAPTESLPLGEALSIVNGCLNPYDYLIED